MLFRCSSARCAVAATRGILHASKPVAIFSEGGAMHREAIERTIARWEEYGPLNTARGVLADGHGHYCAIGDIARVELGFDDEVLRRRSAFIVVWDPKAQTARVGVRPCPYQAVQAALDVSPMVVRRIANLNDVLGRRPVEFMRDLLAYGEEGALERNYLPIPRLGDYHCYHGYSLVDVMKALEQHDPDIESAMAMALKTTLSSSKKRPAPAPADTSELPEAALGSPAPCDFALADHYVKPEAFTTITA